MNTDKVRELRLGELSCGPGGLALGAMTARINDPEYRVTHRWVNDYDANTRKTYRRNICLNDKESATCGGVRKPGIEPLGDIDAPAFGSPYNDSPVVGEQERFDDTLGLLYTYGARVLKWYQPLWLLTENAGELKDANERQASKKTQEDLAKTGCRAHPNLHKFEEYGIPQARHRMVAVGIREDLPCEFRIPSTEPYKDKDISCRTTIRTPETPADAPNNELTKQSLQVVERLSYIKPGQNAFTADTPEKPQLKMKGARVSQVYKRFSPDKPAHTVTGSEGDGAHIYYYEESRALTNRERVRLQTFPDNFIFESSKESVRKRTGMAVPADDARITSEAILETFTGIPYDNMAPYIRSGD